MTEITQASPKLFVQSLLSKTLEGVIPWKGTAHPLQFQISFTRYSVKILKNPLDSGEEVYSLRIYNHKAELVDTLEDDQGLLRELYRNARRIGMGAARVFDELLGELERLDF